MKPVTSKIRKIVLLMLGLGIVGGLTAAYLAAMTASLTSTLIPVDPFLAAAAAATLGFLVVKTSPFGRPYDLRRRYIERRLTETAS